MASRAVDRWTRPFTAESPTRDRLVTAAFFVIVLGSVAYWYHLTRNVWFFADEWAMAHQVGGPRSLFEPYNGHLSVLILGLNRVLLGLVGFSTHGPYRLAGLLSFAAVGVAMFLTTRRAIGATLAAALGLLLLWPRGISLEAGGLNHSLALAGGIVCAYGLRDRGRRADLFVGAGLVFALCAAGGGVAVAVAAVLHSACTRAGKRRWLLVAVPTAAWVLWWRVTTTPDPAALKAMRPGVVELFGHAFTHARESFAYLALGNQFVGFLLFVAFIACAVWRLRQGLAAAANVIAWTGAMAFWWLGLEWTRPYAMEGFTFRYEFLSIGFAVLAVLPPGLSAVRSAADPAAGPATDGDATDEAEPTAATPPEPAPDREPAPRWAVIAAPVAVLVLGLLLVAAVRPDAVDFAEQNGAFGRSARAQVGALGLTAVPGTAQFGLGLGGLTAQQTRALVRHYGEPPGYGDPDVVVRRSPSFRVERTGRQGKPASCKTLVAGRSFPPESNLVLYSADGAASVQVKRFGSAWIDVGAIPAGERWALSLPSLLAPQPWNVRAKGACVAAV